MPRSMSSAKAAGSRHARSVTDYLRVHVSRFIEKMPLYGGKDRGDAANVETFNQLPVAVEFKDYGGRFLVGTWLTEVEIERLNLPNAIAGVVVAKRRGTTDPGRQVVFMTVDDLVALLSGKRPGKSS